METIIAKTRTNLTNQADEQIRRSNQRFFKQEIKSYGVKTSQVGKLAKKQFNALKNFEKDAVFALCEELWKSGYLEESFIACEWSFFMHKKFQPSDFQLFEGWLHRYVTNWASCDTLCNHTIGTFIENFPEFLVKLKSWTLSENRWVRRGAAVSLIVPARRGKFLNDLLEIAEALLTDKDEMIQKGYGWLLKVASQAHQQEIYNFVMTNKARMPRTALRYAVEKMPEDLRRKAMLRD